MKQKTFSYYSLGCKVNQAEMEKLTRSLLNCGFARASLKEKADICIINTCTVTGTAEQKSRQKIRKAIKDNRGAFVIVTGCYAQAQKKIIEEIPGVSLVLNNKEKKSISKIIRNKFLFTEREEKFPFIKEGRTRAFLKVQDGCNNYCSYCIIPFVRGNQVSIKKENILEDAKNLSEGGYKEIVLTGINLGTYGKDLSPPSCLTNLIEEILNNTPLKRLRISSIEPPDIDKPLLNLMKSHKVFCRHLHVPLQYGHNKILELMNRNYKIEDFKEIIAMARSEVKQLSVTTDVMVGFPGETEEFFKKNLEFIKQLNFSKLHVFSYSPRKGTKAFKFPGKVDGKTKKERSKLLLETGEKLTKKFHRSFMGETLPVLFEHRPDKKTGNLKGLTDNYIPVIAEGNKKYLGEIVQVKLLDLIGDKVFGKIDKD